MSRCAIVAAVGGKDPTGGAYALGQFVARCGAILLTGGKPPAGGDGGSLGRTKDVALSGARCGASDARLIGVFPSDRSKRDWIRPNLRALYLSMGVPHNVRNVINGYTADVVVAFAGEQGTLAEIAFALAYERPLVFAPRSVGFLRDALKVYTRTENLAEFKRIYF